MATVSDFHLSTTGAVSVAPGPAADGEKAIPNPPAPQHRGGILQHREPFLLRNKPNLGA